MQLNAEVGLFTKPSNIKHMKPIAAIIFESESQIQGTELLHSLKQNPFIEKIIIIKKPNSPDITEQNVLSIVSDFPSGGISVTDGFDAARASSHALVISEPSGIHISNDETKRFLQIAEKFNGALYYADYYFHRRGPSNVIPVLDYQYGSIRDDFWFGPVQFFSLEHVYKSFLKCGKLADTKWSGLYELRLKVSTVGDIVRIPEPLCLAADEYNRKKSHFTYVDPKQLDYQKESEKTATEHLKRVGALCSHPFKAVMDDPAPYPVEASVIIPVRNREKTIADAIRSALSQKTDFLFNVLVVQNHSTDKTGSEIQNISKNDPRVIEIIPDKTGHGIGGCWNEAIQSQSCGRYVCQLDSDDLYDGEYVLSEIVDTLSSGRYGMVVGSYRVVNFNLEEIPPGVVDHREWSEENGRNNLLRVQGIGAPRAFPTSLLRKYPFPDVSYGEDYAVSLRLSRDFRVGRIYKPLYLCRRWEENTDSNLSKVEENRLAFYKDKLRTQEIMDRKKLNKC
jgi:hypothetical protein